MLPVLLRNGADEVVYPEKQVANWAAIRYTADHIRDYIEVDEDHAIFEVEVPEGWIGTTVGEDVYKRQERMLNKAFEKFPSVEGLIFHSDQGWQYQHCLLYTSISPDTITKISHA